MGPAGGAERLLIAAPDDLICGGEYIAALGVVTLIEAVAKIIPEPLDPQQTFFLEAACGVNRSAIG